MEQATSSVAAGRDRPFREPLIWGVASSLVVAVVFLVVLAMQPGASAPARPGDGPDYDNLAFHLARNHGFGLGFSDPEFLAPYERENHGGRFDYLFERTNEFHSITSRPPALPAMLSFVYRIVGRNFLVVRVMQILLAACAIGLAVALAAHLGGAIAANVTLVCAVVDSLARSDSTLIGYCFDVLTEPLAQLLLMSLIWSLVLLEAKPNWWRSLAAGTLLGLLIMSRAVFVLWIPWMLMWTMAIGVAAYRRKRTEAGPAWLGLGLLLGTSLVVTPWWIRNCVVLQDFMPLGTHGWVSLLGGYCEEAVEARGNWSSAPVDRCWVALNEQAWFQEIESPVIRDREFALVCRERAMDWIASHPRMVGRLFFRRLTTHWFPYRGKVVLLSLAALTGLVLSVWLGPRHPALTLITYVLLINSVVVMLTYTTGGRFLVPLYPVLYLLAGLGTARLIARATASSQ